MMRALIQRVNRASVTVGGEVVGEIGRGLCLLVGVGQGDTEEDARYLAQKIASLRIFPDEAGRFNRSLLETGGQVLVVSQFTLYADTRRGRRPDFIQAAPPAAAEALIESLTSQLRELGLKTATGRFQEHMVVHIENDGPVTIWLDSRERFLPRNRPSSAP